MAKRTEQFDNKLISNRFAEAWRRKPKIPHITTVNGLWGYLASARNASAARFVEKLNERSGQ